MMFHAWRSNWIDWLNHVGRSYLRRYGTPIFLTLALLILPVLIILDGQRLLAYSFHFNLWYIFLSVIISYSSLLLTIPAWHLILTRLGGPSTYRDDVRIYCYSLIGFVIPGSIWPFLSRAALYERQGISAVNVTVATMVELLLVGLAGLIVYGLTLMSLPQKVIWQRPEIAILTIGLSLIFIQPPIFNRISTKILSWFEKTKKQVVALTYRDLIILFTLETLTIMLGGTALYYLLKSFVSVSPTWYFTIVSAWGIGVAASNLFFWFPGKPILRDGIMALVLTQILLPSLTIVYIIIIRIWTILSVLLVCGLAWLFLDRKFIIFENQPKSP